MTTKKKSGRPAGARNKLPANRRLAARQVGMQPLEYLLSIMTDEEQDQHIRVDAAKAAAPYCHSRLQSITVQEKPFEGDPNELTNEYLAHIVAGTGSSDVIATTKGSKVTH